MQLKHFDIAEFDSPDSPGSGNNMQNSTLVKLAKARELAGIPFVISSGYRTEAHNYKVGGVLKSAHTRGYAVDIAAENGRARLLMIEALLKAGFNRIGVAKSFVHVDDDPDKPSKVMWTY